MMSNIKRIVADHSGCNKKRNDDLHKIQKVYPFVNYNVCTFLMTVL